MIKVVQVFNSLHLDACQCSALSPQAAFLESVPSILTPQNYIKGLLESQRRGGTAGHVDLEWMIHIYNACQRTLMNNSPEGPGNPPRPWANQVHPFLSVDSCFLLDPLTVVAALKKAGHCDLEWLRIATHSSIWLTERPQCLVLMNWILC